MKHLLLLFLIVFTPFVILCQSVLPDETKIVYSASEKPLTEVIKEISKKSEINISFQDEIFDSNPNISIISRGKPLGLVLDKILATSNVKYKMIGNQIVLIKTEEIKNESIRISGYISDSESGEKLPFASVYLHDKSQGTSSNEYGFYSMKVPAGEIHIYFSYLGYKLEIKDFKSDEDLTINIDLKSNTKLNEVIVIESPENAEEENAIVEILSIDNMHSRLPLGGEPDVLRLSYMLPGVSTGADGFGGMSIRGGSLDENLILLDGIPVYNANHAMGVFSIFNSDVIKSTKLYKAGFPAEFGGKLSSVLDIRTREGNNNKTSGSISMGMLAAKATIEGPILKGKSSYLLSARRTFLDPWISLVTSSYSNITDSDQFTKLYFYDINAKVNFFVSKKSKLYLSLYNGQDVFDSQNTKAQEVSDTSSTEDIRNMDWVFKNTLGAIRWNYQASNKLFFKSSFYLSRYNFEAFDISRFNIRNSNEEVLNSIYRTSLYNSDIQDLGLKINVDLLQNKSHTFRFGLEAINHRYRPGLLRRDNTDRIDKNIEITKSYLLSRLIEDERIGNEVRIFLEDQITLSQHAKLNVGINQAFHLADSVNYVIPEPRIAFSFIKNRSKFKTSFSYLSQYSHVLSNSGISLPIDLWVPTTDVIKPAVGWIAAASYEHKIGSNYTIGVEGYYKEMNQLSAFNEGNFVEIDTSTNWEFYVANEGFGQAYGTEVYINKPFGKVTYNLNYTWSKSIRKFPEINNGRTFPYRFDRRHQVKFNTVYAIGSNAEFSLNWVYTTGSPFSLPSTYGIETDQEGNEILVFDYDSKNGNRLSDYHRLDIGFNLYNNFKWGRSKFTVGAYNVYDRKNIYYIEVYREDAENNEFDFRGLNLLPILPTLSYSLSF